MDLQQRAGRAAALAHSGELSAASAALEAAPLAPAKLEAVTELRDPPTCPGWRNSMPLACLRLTPSNSAPTCSGRAGAPRQTRQVPRASTCGCCSMMKIAVTSCISGGVSGPCRCARTNCGLRLGRLVALQKHARGIRALVMGDAFRRLVSRTLAQPGTQLPEACAPFQYALATRAGTEALAHAFRFVAEPHQSGTVINVEVGMGHPYRSVDANRKQSGHSWVPGSPPSAWHVRCAWPESS